MAGIIERYALCTIFDEASIFEWKSHLFSKYSSFKGIKSFKDFRIKLAVFQKPVLLYRECLYEGGYSNTCKMKVNESVQLSPMPEQCYTLQRLSAEKLAHLTDMYNRYIPLDRRLPWLPSPPSLPVPVTTCADSEVSSTSRVTSEAARVHQKSLRKKN